MTFSPLESDAVAAFDGKENQMRTLAEMVAEAKAKVNEISPEELIAAREGGALVVDLREPEERVAKGTIPGAVFAPRGMLEFWADPASPYHRPEFDPDSPVVLYCASGGRSALGARTLEDLGYQDVSHLEGGLNRWLEEGRAVESTLASS
jgi:rhodanese-related sulfurtransferase